MTKRFGLLFPLALVAGLLNVPGTLAIPREEAAWERPEPKVGFGPLAAVPYDTGAVDLVDYDINVRLFPANHFLQGEAQVIFRSKVPQLTEADFILYNDTLNVLSVTSGSDTLSWAYDPTYWVLRVFLNDTLVPGGEDTVTIAYSGYITPELSRALSNYCRLDGTLGFSTITPYVWYPASYDHAYSTRRDDKVTCRVTLTVPLSWRAVSLGTLMDSSATDSTQTYTWGTAAGVMNMSFAAGPYLLCIRQFQGMPLRYYDFDTTYAEPVFNTAQSILSYFNRVYCPKPMEKLAYVENLQIYGFGAPTLVMMPLPYQLFGQAHETSHQWWGWALCLRYSPEVWLNEGFASYSEILFQEDTLGRAVRQAELDTMAWRYLAVPRAEDRPIVPAPTASRYYFTIVYNKGAWVLHMLRGMLGDSTFFNVIKTYATTYRDSSVTVAMFQQTAEQVSGRNLGWFFDEWLYRRWAPRYTYSWQAFRQASDSVLLRMWVDQQDSLFEMPIQTTIYTPGGEREEWAWVKNPSDTFEFWLSEEPYAVVLDKDDWLLDRGITLGVGSGPGERNLRTGPALSPAFPNPFSHEVILTYTLSKPGTPVLRVYDITGRLVRTLKGEGEGAGQGILRWDGRDGEGATAKNGVYFLSFQCGQYREIRRVVRLK